MRTCIYPGSFDPITIGHLDIIKRASEIFDKVTVCIMINSKKKSTFTLEKRKEFISKSVSGMKNVDVDIYEGLLVDYAKKSNCNLIVRGLRNQVDFETELTMASMNKQLYPELETVFLMTDPAHAFVSSSMVREAIRFNGDVSNFVPKCIVDEIDENNLEQA